MIYKTVNWIVKKVTSLEGKMKLVIMIISFLIFILIIFMTNINAPTSDGRTEISATETLATETLATGSPIIVRPGDMLLYVNKPIEIGMTMYTANYLKEGWYLVTYGNGGVGIFCYTSQCTGKPFPDRLKEGIKSVIQGASIDQLGPIEEGVSVYMINTTSYNTELGVIDTRSWEITLKAHALSPDNTRKHMWGQREGL